MKPFSNLIAIILLAILSSCTNGNNDRTESTTQINEEQCDSSAISLRQYKSKWIKSPAVNSKGDNTESYAALFESYNNGMRNGSINLGIIMYQDRAKFEITHGDYCIPIKGVKSINLEIVSPNDSLFWEKLATIDRSSEFVIDSNTRPAFRELQNLILSTDTLVIRANYSDGGVTRRSQTFDISYSTDSLKNILSTFGEELP